MVYRLNGALWSSHGMASTWWNARARRLLRVSENNKCRSLDSRSGELKEAFERLRKNFRFYVEGTVIAPAYNPKQHTGPIEFLVEHYGTREQMLEKGYHSGLLKKDDEKLYEALRRYVKKHQEGDLYMFVPSKREAILYRQELISHIFGDDEFDKISGYVRAAAECGDSITIK